MCYSVREDLDVGQGIDGRVWSTGLMATCSLVALGVWHRRPVHVGFSMVSTGSMGFFAEMSAVSLHFGCFLVFSHVRCMSSIGFLRLRVEFPRPSSEGGVHEAEDGGREDGLDS